MDPRSCLPAPTFPDCRDHGTSSSHRMSSSLRTGRHVSAFLVRRPFAPPTAAALALHRSFQTESRLSATSPHVAYFPGRSDLCGDALERFDRLFALHQAGDVAKLSQALESYLRLDRKMPQSRDSRADHPTLRVFLGCSSGGGSVRPVFFFPPRTFLSPLISCCSDCLKHQILFGFVDSFRFLVLFFLRLISGILPAV